MDMRVIHSSPSDKLIGDDLFIPALEFTAEQSGHGKPGGSFQLAVFHLGKGAHRIDRSAMVATAINPRAAAQLDRIFFFFISLRSFKSSVDKGVIGGIDQISGRNNQNDCQQHRPYT